MPAAHLVGLWPPDLGLGGVDAQVDPVGGGVGEHVRQGVQSHARCVGHPVTKDQAVVGPGAGGALAWVTAALLEGALVRGGPGVGQLDRQVGQLLPGQPGEDRMGEGRTGPCWRRHPRMITRAAWLMLARRCRGHPRGFGGDN